MDTQQNELLPSPKPAGQASSSGCGTVLAIGGLGGWTVIVTLLALGALAYNEQDLMAKVQAPPDLRWLGLALLGLAIGLPGLAVWWFTRASRIGAAAKLFAYAGGFVLLQAPARLAGAQESQLGMLAQLMGMLVFGLVLWLTDLRGWRGLWSWQAEGLGWALAMGGGLGLPWVVLSALGSPLDSLLALLTGLAAGAACVLALRGVLRQDSGTLYGYGVFLLDGLLAALFLLSVAVALGANGASAILALVVPLLGWVAAGLMRSDAAGGRSNWPVPALFLGLAFFWPLAFVDLEELLYILMSPGESMQWVWTAALIDWLLSGLALIAALILLRFWLANRLARLAGYGLAGALWAALLVVYLLAGKPGFHGERLFVILKDQADLSLAQNISDPVERRKAVYQALVTHADTSQAGLRAYLDGLGVRYKPYYLVNAIEVQGEPLFHFVYASRPEVDRVLIGTRLRPLPFPLPAEEGQSGEAPDRPEWNLIRIRAPQVWEELGVTGAGVIIGQSDTGVQREHPEVRGGYLRRGESDDYSWYDPWYGSLTPMDYGAHGTHTLATVVGQSVGVAPGASWIACVNLGRNLANPALYLECMQFHLAPFPAGGSALKDGRPELGAQVLNNSWGCPAIEGCDARALEAGVKALRAAGVFVVASAGNDGMEGCSSVASPIALYDDVISVGASDQDNILAYFSSLGPVTADGSGRVKPDLVAPGVEIYSAVPGGYTWMSGTSMAGPHVAGVVALMWSANPKLIGDVERTEEILLRTADQIIDSGRDCGGTPEQNNMIGYGFVDAYQAVQEALKLK